MHHELVDVGFAPDSGHTAGAERVRFVPGGDHRLTEHCINLKSWNIGEPSIYRLRLHLVPINNEHLAGLIQAIAVAERRHIAVGLANTLKAINSAAGLSAADRLEATEAEAAWVSSSAALTRYHTTHF